MKVLLLLLLLILDVLISVLCSNKDEQKKFPFGTRVERRKSARDREVAHYLQTKLSASGQRIQNSSYPLRKYSGVNAHAVKSKGISYHYFSRELFTLTTNMLCADPICQHLPDGSLKRYPKALIRSCEFYRLSDRIKEGRSKRNDQKKENPKYYFSILAIFKNEAGIMKEWLSHHIAHVSYYFFCSSRFNFPIL